MTLKVFFSGGASNTDPLLSLGGAISNTAVDCQILTTSTAITGVTLDYSSGNPLGDHDLVYDATNATLTWAGGKPVTIDGDGSYVLYGIAYQTGYQFYYPQVNANIVTASLPVANTTATYTVSENPNGMFPDISALWTYQGRTIYLCYYVKNVGTKDKTDVSVFTPIIPVMEYNDVLPEIGLDVVWNTGTEAIASPDLFTFPTHPINGENYFIYIRNSEIDGVKPSTYTTTGLLAVNEWFGIYVHMKLPPYDTDQALLDGLRRFTLSMTYRES